MTTVAREPALLNSVDARQARIGRATQNVHALALALTANCALLDTPAAQCSTGWTETGGTYSLSYVRNPGARYVRLEALIHPSTTVLGTSVTLDLTVRDAAGHSVTSSDDRIPRRWRAETVYAPLAVAGSARLEFVERVIGYVDCDALDDDLTDPSWSFDVALTVSGGAQVESLSLSEMPRFVVDDAAGHGGVIPGAYQRDTIIHDGLQDGLRRLLSTLDSGRLSQRTYLGLAWRQALVSAETPSLTGTSDGPFTLLDGAGSGGRLEWALVPRSIRAASAAGEPCKVRYLYRFQGGAGTETGQISLRGSATGSPWTLSSIAYTTSWTWSAWVDCAVRTSPLSDALSLSGKVSASGPTLWLAGVHVREAVT
jgi:hypothetical protein